MREVKGFDYQIFWSHANPIPDCFNLITEQALADPGVTHLWFVEEDMVLPKGVLRHIIWEMTEAHCSAIACDYPLVQAPSATIYRDPRGKAYFTGCGCLLVKRKVFDKPPYWRADVIWDIDIESDYLKVTPHWAKGKVYGMQDITFGLSLYIKGTPINISSMVCGQREVVKRGNKDSNAGSHKIIEYTDISKRKVFETTKSPLVEFYSPEDMDDRLHVSPDQVDKMLDGGWKRFLPGQLVINDVDKVWEAIK